MLTIFKFIWDAIAVTFNIFTFVNLDNRELISLFFQRNIKVTSVIMVFVCLGVVKIPLNIYTLCHMGDDRQTQLFYKDALIFLIFISLLLTFVVGDFAKIEKLFKIVHLVLLGF